ncbi:hypothetical protein RJ639_035621 [Escallonia herrerae]|uniref:Uncharacterized protein n=1 Tax=Escallonia herrerae TaxID=1293975 RepID=A0AA88WVA4_9ASTE|nr:hypothetical protein RJ639_035621 [Escallonia herrerae]
MAKKKPTQHGKPPQTQEEQAHHQALLAMEESSEKLENLKSLNSLLLKETVERRQQVDSLKESNGALESELSRSKMEKDGLEAELARLSELAVMAEMERTLVFVFVAVQVGERAEAIVKERDGLEREKVEIKKKMEGLERDMRKALQEKSEIERVKSEKESAVKVLEIRVNELVRDIGKEKDESGRVSQERDELRANLDAQIEETNGLILKLEETEKRENGILEEVEKIKTAFKGVMEEKEEREVTIESLMRDKDATERSLAESNRVIQEMMRELTEIVREKVEIEEERNVEVGKRRELENSVDELNETVSGLKREKEGLRQVVGVLEKTCNEGVEKQKDMVKQIGVLVEKRNELEKRFEGLIEEKGLIMKQSAEALEQLDAQKLKEENIIREKIEIEEMKLRRENEIVELRKQVSRFKDAILKAEESCMDKSEDIKKLKCELLHCRDELGRVGVQRDEAIRDLGEEKMSGMKLREKVLEMEKNIEETHKVFEEVKAEKNNLDGEKKELESRCATLLKNIDSVDSKLDEAQRDIDAMQAKVALANANSDLVLNMLRNTVTLVGLSKDEKAVMDETWLIDQQKAGEEVNPYVVELEAIKNAFESRERHIKDINRQAEFLRKSVAEANKRKSFWTVVSSATTFLAAASIVYVARGH